MSKKMSLPRVLAQAKKSENEFNWLQAINYYETAKAKVMKKEDLLKAGEIQERIGFCFQQDAFQADVEKTFRDRVHQAIKAYEKANEIYEKLLNQQKSAKQFRCNAYIKYLSYWIASDPAEKKKLLDECLEAESKALAEFSTSGDILNYGRTYGELSLVFFCRIFLEWDRQTLKNILDRGLEWGEQAIEGLGKLGAPHETGWSYLTAATCLSDAGFYLIAESEELDDYRLKAVDYLKKAVALAEETNDRILLGMSYLWLGTNAGGEEAKQYHGKTLELGKQTRNNFLIANGLDFLAYDSYWKALASESPEERRELAERAMEFYDEAQDCYDIISFMSPRGGVIGPPSGQAEHHYQLALWETNSEKRAKLLKRSEKLATEALTLAENLDMPMVIAQVLHVFSKILQAQAHTVEDIIEKRNRLERALKYREKTVEIFGGMNPFFFWNLGVMQNYLAGIKVELARITPDLEHKRRFLEEAALSKENCLKLFKEVMPSLERKGETALFAALQRYQDTYATLLIRLYDLTGNPGYLQKTIRISKEAIKSAKKLDLVSLEAASYWKIAKALDSAGDHSQAARNFKHASKCYIKAAGKIPQLYTFYRDHASYMEAWNEIENARISHAAQKYGQAEKHYERAAGLHRATDRWKYLSSNYLAWARLEEAEDLSRGDRVKQAILQFKKAAKLFREVKNDLQLALDTIENAEEEDLAERLIKASVIRVEYCIGRIALEEAKILSRRGNHGAGAAKYGMAAEKFKNLLDTIEHESKFTSATITKDRQELNPIIYLCQAWQMMAKAEAETSPELFLEASKLFERAKESSVNEGAKLLASGHSRFCKALEAGARFEDSSDTKFYIAATQHLENAANFYVRAGFKVATDYAIATQRFLDAYVYIANAKKEPDPGKKARYYIAAEKVLQISIGSYLKAKHPAKSEQVQRILERIREERELAVSLSEILVAPTITSSTTSFVTPSPSEETAAGLERLEQANIQADLILHTNEIPLGGNLELKIQITNVGKSPILLDRVEGLLPLGFRLVDKPSYFHLEKTHLNLNGKKLEPLKTEEIKLVLKAFTESISELRPRIIFVDNTGTQFASELEAETVEVSKLSLPGRIATGYESLDNQLFGGIPENHAVIVTSPPCDERDLLIERFLETGAKEGQITFYITTRTTEIQKIIEKYPRDFYLFICNPQAEKIAKGKPNVFMLKGVENLTDINIAVASTLRKLNSSTKTSKRCCIDIISDVLLQHKALQTRRWLTNLLTQLRSRGFTILSVMDLEMHPLREVRAVIDLFEGEINLDGKKSKTRAGRSLTIRRLGGQRFLADEISISRD